MARLGATKGATIGGAVTIESRGWEGVILGGTMGAACEAKSGASRPAISATWDYLKGDGFVDYPVFEMGYESLLRRYLFVTKTN